jgi:hypothetical protein
LTPSFPSAALLPPPSVEPAPNPPSLHGALSNLPSHRGAPSILSSRPLWILPHHLHITAPHQPHSGSSSTTTVPRMYVAVFLIQRSSENSQLLFVIIHSAITAFCSFCRFCQYILYYVLPGLLSSSHSHWKWNGSYCSKSIPIKLKCPPPLFYFSLFCPKFSLNLFRQHLQSLVYSGRIPFSPPLPRTTDLDYVTLYC